jgi:hypothetical protein
LAKVLVNRASAADGGVSEQAAFVAIAQEISQVYTGYLFHAIFWSILFGKGSVGCGI